MEVFLREGNESSGSSLTFGDCSNAAKWLGGEKNGERKEIGGSNHFHG